VEATGGALLAVSEEDARGFVTPTADMERRRRIHYENRSRAKKIGFPHDTPILENRADTSILGSAPSARESSAGMRRPRAGWSSGTR
jgi:hypothetical protein